MKTYDDIAEWYDSWVGTHSMREDPYFAPTLHSVARILCPGGWFVFAILHPCFHTSRSGEMETPQGTVRTIGSYFVEGYWHSDTRPGPPGKFGAYHRTLSTYINTLSDVGLQLVHLSEPQAAPITTGSPSLSGSSRPVWTQVPAVLVARCRKPESIGRPQGIAPTIYENMQ